MNPIVPVIVIVLTSLFGWLGYAEGVAQCDRRDLSRFEIRPGPPPERVAVYYWRPPN